MTAIKVAGLTKIYTNKWERILANDGISFEVKEGEIVGILGPNGAGKTTLIKQIIGQLKPSSGSISVMGYDVVKSPRTIQKYLGYMPQLGYTHLSHLNVVEAMYYTGILRGFEKESVKTKIDWLIERMDLCNERQRLIGHLSGGKAQAVRLCLAVIGEPRLIILDEPTSGLDPELRIKFWGIISDIYEREKMTVIWVTHNVHEAEFMVHRVMIMRQGKVLVDGTPPELKERVYGNLRIEVIFKGKDKIPSVLLTQPNSLLLQENHYFVILPKDGLGNRLLEILSQLTFEDIDDIRITPISLEDVYIQLVKERLE
ncbi:MAG: ABC transporter ATP-binding protein [bacterium]